MNPTAFTWQCLVVLFGLLLAGCGSQSVPLGEQRGTPVAEGPFAGRSIEVFVGSATRPATEEAAARFEQQTGAKVILHFGGSGQVLSQLRLANRGDIYFPGSSDYMELAKRAGDVIPESETRVVYLIPAINVPRGNPSGIVALEDLGKPGVRVGIARPDAVCVGLYAAEVLEKNGLAERVRPNIVTQAESCAKTAQLVSMNMVDAVLGWRVFQYWDPERIETVPLRPEQVTRIGYVSAAVAKKAADRSLAEAFLNFLISAEGQAIYRKWHYLTTEQEARKYAAPEATIGGEWTLPEAWQ